MTLHRLSDAVARTAALLLALAALALASTLPVAAQGTRGLDIESSDEPVHIEADELEVFDDQGRAVFSGNVVATQGDMTLNAVKLTVHYAGGAMTRGAGEDDGEADGEQAGGQGEGNSQRIERLDAEGKVVVVTKEQRATAEKAVFRMAENSITMTGDVVLSQGGNVLRGTELVVDLDTGRSRLVSNTPAGQPSRVSGVFVPGSAPRPGGDQQ